MTAFLSTSLRKFTARTNGNTEKKITTQREQGWRVEVWLKVRLTRLNLKPQTANYNIPTPFHWSNYTTSPDYTTSVIFWCPCENVFCCFANFQCVMQAEWCQQLRWKHVVPFPEFLASKTIQEWHPKNVIALLSSVIMSCTGQLWHFSFIATVNTFDGRMQFEISDIWPFFLHSEAGLDPALAWETLSLIPVSIHSCKYHHSFIIN